MQDNSSQGELNPVTENLKPYPMEELRRIKSRLISEGKEVFDFGTGDPKIPIESFIAEEVKKYTTTTSGYPSIVGPAELKSAHINYLKNRYDLNLDDQTSILPTRGSKEAVFHLALCVVGRKGKKRVIYPEPGYPVYESSTLYAGGIPTPYLLNEENNYLLEPWKLDKEIIENTAAIWINYPHNPTGTTVDKNYFRKFVDYCRENDILILSDDCYIDIYHSDFDEKMNVHKKPPLIIENGSKGIISLHSLSKRSGLTGYRAGFMVGDKSLLTKIQRARSNMGLAQTTFISMGAAAAWNDEAHVTKRRKIFTDRLAYASDVLTEIGIKHIKPEATFYLWCKVPDKYAGDDVKFCLELASEGIISSPSSWLGAGSKGFFRLAMVPDLEKTKQAMKILKEFIK